MDFSEDLGMSKLYPQEDTTWVSIKELSKYPLEKEEVGESLEKVASNKEAKDIIIKSNREKSSQIKKY